ncbi:MAG: helix-turn-helix domain-containing protein [Sciscionella sp.]
MTDDLAGRSTGERIHYFRTRLGMTRAVLGGLVGRSAEWVKAVEGGRLLTPRLGLLIRLAEVLKVDDPALLTGEPKLASATYSRSMHEKLPVMTRALADHPAHTSR